MDIFNESFEEINRASRNMMIPRYLAAKFNKTSGFIVMSGIAFCFFLMSIGFFDKFICDLLTTYFPAKWTLKSILNPSFASDKLWVTYWIVYFLLKIVDDTIPFAIQFIPFYYAIKCFFLMVLYAPKIKGGLIIYSSVIAPGIKKINTELKHLLK